MSTCVEKLPCSDCGSSDSLQTYLNIDDTLGIEWYSSFCHGQCWENKGDPYVGGKAPEVHVKTAEEIAEELEAVRSCKIFNPRKGFRGIPSVYYRSWGIRILLSEFDGKTPYAIAFPYSVHGILVGWKCRPLRKKDFYGVGNTRDVDPFGIERALKIHDGTLWITEGEFDAIALDYAMVMYRKSRGYPVVSLTHGGGSIEKNLIQIMDRLHTNKIKRLALVLDDDEVGHEAEVTAKQMWDNVIIVPKPMGYKDANEVVKAGLAEEMGESALNLL